MIVGHLQKLFEGVSLITELVNLEKMPYPSNCEAQGEALVLDIEYSAFEQHFLDNAYFLLLFVKSLTQKIFNLERIIHSNIALDAPSRFKKAQKHGHFSAA